MIPDRIRLLALPAATMLVVALAGCALGRSGPSVSILAPEVAPVAESGTSTLAAAIAVARPQTDRTRDSDRILVRQGRRLMPYPGAAWLDRMPDMVQSLLVESLGSSARFTAVGRHGELRADYRLVTEVRRFEALDAGGSGLTVEVAIQAGLVEQTRRELVGSRRFSQQVAVGDKSLESLVAGFETAMGELFGEMANWIAEAADVPDTERPQGKDQAGAEPAGEAL